MSKKIILEDKLVHYATLGEYFILSNNLDRLDEHIEHHGVQGQKWGVRNGPPYPLQPGSRTNETKGFSEKARDFVDKHKNERAGLIDPVTDYILFSYVMPIVFMFTYVAVSNHLTIKKMKQEQEDNKKLTPGDYNKIKGKHSRDDDMAAINPNFNSGDKGYTMNCALCSTSYELRQRGYDVTANKSVVGRRNEEISAYFNKTKDDFQSSDNYDDFVKKLNAMPDGSRGITCTGAGYFDSRHAMVWEKDNGKVTIRDCQSNTKYDTIDQSPVNKESSSSYDFIRTDDAEINFDLIKDASKNR